MKLSAKKPISLFVSLVLLLTLLAACGSSADSTSSTDSTESTASSEGAADESENTAAAADIITIVCSTNGAPNPFTYADEDGNPVGYDIELVQAVFELLPQYELEVRIVSDALGDVDSGRAQLSANNWGYKDERAEKYLYSEASFQNNYVIAVAEDNDSIQVFDDLQGKTCEAATGGNYAIAMENYNASLSGDAEPIIIQYADSDLLLQLQNIESGKTDFQIIDEQMFNQYLDEYGLKLKGVTLSADDMERIGTPYSYIIFEKSDLGREVRDAFNEALAEVLTNGTGDAISDKYFGADFAPEPGIKAPSEA